MAVSANRLEILQIADAVAREKSIEEGYEMVTFVTNGDGKAEISAARTLSKLNLAGLIYGAAIAVGWHLLREDAERLMAECEKRKKGFAR